MSDVQPSPIARPIRTAFQWWIAFARAGWRPAAGWVCVLILIANGVVLPIARLFHVQLEPLAWHDLAMFVTALCGLSGLRTVEKVTGAAD